MRAMARTPDLDVSYGPDRPSLIAGPDGAKARLTDPPRKLTAPREPAVNGRPPIGWSLIGQQGFPAITVPAGFTTEVWDRVRDGQGTRLVGPVAAALPVGLDFLARPFDEALLVRIAKFFQDGQPPVASDETLELFEVISISAGQRGLQIFLAPADYLRATGARTADITQYG